MTASQVLSTAATLDGKVASSLDQTGLAQKGGQVVANLYLGEESSKGAAKVGVGQADSMLLFDVIGGSMPAVLERGDPEHTRAIVSTSRVPTGQMVTRIDQSRFPETNEFRVRIDAATVADENTWVDAEAIARFVFGSQPAANMLVVGMAYQQGMIPVNADAIEEAIRLNGVAIDMNTEAFTLGRRLVVDEQLAEELALASAAIEPKPPTPTARVSTLINSVPQVDDQLRETLEWRVPELIAWGDEAYAARYLKTLSSIRRSEIDRDITDAPLTKVCLLYTSPSPRDRTRSRMPSSA